VSVCDCTLHILLHNTDDHPAASSAWGPNRDWLGGEDPDEIHFAQRRLGPTPSSTHRDLLLRTPLPYACCVYVRGFRVGVLQHRKSCCVSDRSRRKKDNVRSVHVLRTATRKPRCPPIQGIFHSETSTARGVAPIPTWQSVTPSTSDKRHQRVLTGNSIDGCLLSLASPCPSAKDTVRRFVFTVRAASHPGYEGALSYLRCIALQRCN